MGFRARCEERLILHRGGLAGVGRYRGGVGESQKWAVLCDSWDAGDAIPSIWLLMVGCQPYRNYPPIGNPLRVGFSSENFFCGAFLLVSVKARQSCS